LHQLICSKDVDRSFAALRLNQILEIECGFAEKLVGALRFERQETALDRSGTGSGDISILSFELIGVVRDVLQHRAQILQIEKQQSVLIGNLENHVEYAFLRVVQLQ
jgi:hypothetical protein